MKRPRPLNAANGSESASSRKGNWLREVKPLSQGHTAGGAELGSRPRSAGLQALRAHWGSQEGFMEAGDGVWPRRGRGRP